MKYLLPLLLTFSLLIVPAMAEEDPTTPLLQEEIPSESPVPEVTADSNQEGVTVNVTIQQPEVTETPVVEDPETLETDILDSSEAPESERVFTVISQDELAPVSDLEEPGTMSEVVVQVLGEYQPRTQTITVLDSEGSVLSTSTEFVPGLAGLDYPWITGAVLFGLMLYGIIRLLGGLIRL